MDRVVPSALPSSSGAVTGDSRASRGGATMPGMARGKNTNGEGSKARLRKDGRYETRAVLDTPTGRRRMSFYGATAKEANDQKIEALANQNKGILFSDPKGLTVADYLERSLSDTARYQVSEGTFLRYERTCRNHLLPFFGRLRLRDLMPAHVRAFKARKIEEGLNPNTVGVMQGVLNVALNQAVDDGLLPANPAARVKKAATRGETPMRALPRRGVPPDLRRRRHPGRGLHNTRPPHRHEARRVGGLRLGRPRSFGEGYGHRAVLGGYPNPNAHLHHEDRRRAPSWHWGSHGCDVEGAQGTPARGEDGGFLVGGPRPGFPKHEGEGTPQGFRHALPTSLARGGRSPRRGSLP